MATKTKKHNLRSNSPNNFEMELISQVKELENLKLAYDEPKTIVEKIQNFWNNESKRKLLIDELESVGFQIKKKKIKRNKKQINNNMWKEDLSASQLLLFEKIRDEIKEENAKEIDWNDMKGNYNDARDKEAFLKDFQEKWLVKRDRAVAKNQNCELDDVIFKRTQFLLLANYLFDTYDNNKSHLKYYQIIYQRFAELHNIIGEKVLVLPVSTSFFTAHDNGKKVQSLINWFRTASENKFMNNFRLPSPTQERYISLSEEIFVLSDTEESTNVEDKCTLCNQIHLNTLPPRIRNLLSSSVVDQFEICRLNHAETHIVPDGLSKNYPKNIDFDKLPDRIDNLFSELFDIVIRKTKSIYRDTAIKIYNELGNGARKPIVVMGRFEIFQPGYYGSKGAYVILKILNSLFIESSKLTLNMTFPQKPLEYLAEVLVPETAIRLIAQDQNITLEEAAKIMEDSIEFGMYMHDVEEEDIKFLEDLHISTQN